MKKNNLCKTNVKHLVRAVMSKYERAKKRI